MSLRESQDLITLYIMEGKSTGLVDITSSLEKIKKQLNSCGPGNVLLEGPLLKRSDIIRNWEWRWFALDVSTGKLEYWFHRGDASPKGVVKFDAYSTVTISPINMMKEPHYDTCCFYIITSQRKEYFFCAETPAAAKAWVTTLRATVSVLKAHKEAANLLSGNAQCKLGNVATVLAGAMVTAREAAQDLQKLTKGAGLSPSASFKISSPAAALSPSISFKKLIPAAALSHSASFKKSIPTPDMDSSDLMRETLKVKDVELHQLRSDLKLQNMLIKELADRLTETAHAAESAASSVQVVNKGCKEALSEVDRLRKQLLQAVKQIRNADGRRAAALKVEETALQEAHRCRLELGKLRERGVILEGAMVRVDEDIRKSQVHQSEVAGRLEVQSKRIECTPQAKISLKDAMLQDDNASKVADVDLRVDELMPEAPLNHPTLAGTPQAPEMDLIRSCEDVASELRVESCLLSVNTSTGCTADLRESVSSSQGLASCRVACAEDTSLSGTDHHDNAASVCPTISNLPEVVQCDGDYAVSLQPKPSVPQAPELVLVGSGEDQPSELRIESCLLSVHTQTQCATDLKESVSSSPELASGGFACADDISTSRSGTDHLENAASGCPTTSHPPEVIQCDDDHVIPLQPNPSAPQAPELELAGSCADLASGLRIESCLLPVNSSTECAVDLRESVSSSQELASGGALPSVSGRDYHENAAFLCPTTSKLPEVLQSDDDKAVPLQPSLSADCGNTITANKDAPSKVTVVASGTEDHNHSSNESYEIAVSYEVNMPTVECNELATGLESSEEKVVVKQEHYKLEDISLIFSSWWS